MREQTTVKIQSIEPVQIKPNNAEMSETPLCGEKLKANLTELEKWVAYCTQNGMSSEAELLIHTARLTEKMLLIIDS